MLGLSQRASDTIAATVAGVLAFLVYIAAYMGSTRTDLGEAGVLILLGVGISLTAAGIVMLTLSYSRESCVQV